MPYFAHCAVTLQNTKRPPFPQTAPCKEDLTRHTSLSSDVPWRTTTQQDSQLIHTPELQVDRNSSASLQGERARNFLPHILAHTHTLPTSHNAVQPCQSLHRGMLKLTGINAVTQRCGHTMMRSHNDAVTQRCGHTTMRSHNDAVTHQCSHTSTPNICNTHTHPHSHAVIQSLSQAHKSAFISPSRSLFIIRSLSQAHTNGLPVPPGRSLLFIRSLS